jgi:2-keto-4-pentenoate hydratase
MLAGLIALALAAASACPADPRVSAIAQDWLAKRPVANLTIANYGEARCFSRNLVNALGAQIGPQVGWKIGLWSQGGRAAFHTDRPVLGVLHARMLLPNNAIVPADYGVGPSWESDFIVVVKDEGINAARTREEIYAHLRGWRPFIELVSRNYAPAVTVSVNQLTALDVSARLGVLGDEVAMPGSLDGLLGAVVTARLKDAAGDTTEHGRMLETLGDPIDGVLFVRDAVLAEGGRLKAGDLISIGASTPSRAPKAGQNLTVTYEIGGRTAQAAVQFR